MAEYHLPEIDEAIKSFGERMQKHLENLEDFDAAIKAGGTADEIVNDWEARTLLREMSNDAPAN